MKHVPYKDKDGSELTAIQWADKFEDVEYCLIAQDIIDDIKISTVWLGIVDFDGNYFETAIFLPAKRPIEMIKYSTLAEALLGHETEVYRIRKELNAL